MLLLRVLQLRSVLVCSGNFVNQRGDGGKSGSNGCTNLY